MTGCCSVWQLESAEIMADAECEEMSAAAVMKSSRADTTSWLCLASRCKPLGLRGVSKATRRACSNMPLQICPHYARSESPHTTVYTI